MKTAEPCSILNPPLETIADDGDDNDHVSERFHKHLDATLVTCHEQLDPLLVPPAAASTEHPALDDADDEISKSYKAGDIGHQSKHRLPPAHSHQIDIAVQNSLVRLQPTKNKKLEAENMMRLQAGLRFINMIENTQEVLVWEAFIFIEWYDRGVFRNQVEWGGGRDGGKKCKNWKISQFSPSFSHSIPSFTLFLPFFPPFLEIIGGGFKSENSAPPLNTPWYYV